SWTKFGVYKRYQVAEEPVLPICLPTISAKSLEKKRNAHLVVAALIATFAFAAAITVPGGLQSDKRSKQGTPLFIHEAAFKAFIVTNALTFLYSRLCPQHPLWVMDNILSRYNFWHRTVSNRAQFVSGILGHATIGMVIAFSTGSYVI
ncbi:hypothetical protein Golax_002801, partial [Gossypium laxum]|nr:hypothetical protein [Gossypium laxum]